MADSTLKTRKCLGLAGICIASFLGCIDLTVVNTILPAIGRDFTIPVQSTQWITSIFMVALSAFMVPAGTLADNFGRKKVLIAGLCVFGIGSLLAGVAGGFWWLVLFRFIQGIGCAVLYTVSGAIVSYTFDEHEQGKALGILFGANGIGLAAGPIVGGLFAGIMNWRYAFLINIPFILVSLLLCKLALAEGKAGGRRLDAVGCLLLVVGLTSLVGYLAIEDGPLHPFMLPLSIVTLALFVWHETNTRDPIVEFHFFRQPVFLSSLLATFLLAFYYCSVLLTFPMLLSSQLQKDDVAIGLFLLPATVTFSLTSAWVGGMSDRIGAPRVIVAGLSFLAAASMLLAFAATRPGANWFIPPLMMFGVGWAAVLGPSTLVALGAFPREKAAVAMGTSWTVHNIGGACGIAFAVFLTGQAHDYQSGYRALMLVLAAIILVGGLLFRMLMRGSRPAPAGEGGH